MNIKHILLLVAMVIIAAPEHAYCDSMDDLSNEFSKSFEELIPPPNSSVGADYKLDQVALGTKYTNKSLDLIYKQNQALSDKYDKMIEKYDKIIVQNHEIIRLLSIIAQKNTEIKSEN
jgi:hypothetical protein